MNADEPTFDASSRSRNRDRLLEHDVAGKFFAVVVEQARATHLMSHDHFTVDGTLIEAWASLKSFRWKDEEPADRDPPDDPGNPTVNFHGEKRSNDTHASTTDPSRRRSQRVRATLRPQLRCSTRRNRPPRARPGGQLDPQGVRRSGYRVASNWCPGRRRSRAAAARDLSRPARRSSGSRRAGQRSPPHCPDEHERFHGLRLDEMIREIVRREVRAEVARVIATGPAQPTHVSVAEYAAARSISVSTVRNAIRAGRLPAEVYIRCCMDGFFRVWFTSNDPELLEVADTPRVWASVVALCLLLRTPMRVFDDVSNRVVCDLVPT